MFKFFCVAFACSLILAGCDSKFVESSPDSVKLTGMSLDERLAHKTSVDKRISQMEQAAERVKVLLKMIRKISAPAEYQEIYTPFDFIVDLNEDLKEKIPEGKDGRLVRKGKLEIPIKSLPEECKMLNTRLESNIIYSIPGDSKTTPIGELLEYSIESCDDSKQYLEVLSAEWIGNDLEFKMNRENLNTLFSDLLFEKAMEDTNCKIENGESRIIESFSCTDVEVDISVSEKALIKNIDFKNSGNLRLQSNADIYENNMKKYSISLKVFSDGRFEAEKDVAGSIKESSGSVPVDEL